MNNNTSEQSLTDANRDCLAKAKPGEPMFIILGRDPDGGNIVRLWAQRRKDAGGDPGHYGPVFDIADAMDAWRAAGNLPESAPDAEILASISSTPATTEWRNCDRCRLVTGNNRQCLHGCPEAPPYEEPKQGFCRHCSSEGEVNAADRCFECWFDWHRRGSYVDEADAREQWGAEA